jgi:tetratricopeptide (TPR) repeat protein
MTARGSLMWRSYSRLVLLIVLIACYLAVIRPFAGYMHRKPVVEKLGVFPRVEVFQFMAADQKQFVAASLVMKVMMYFGGLMDEEPAKYRVTPDYQTMSRVLHGAVRLDPYNMDAYYFAQAFLVWDVGAYKIANDLLDYGMRHRTWDLYLPFFAGFNSAYFLKDYASAARYYRKAADLSGEPLFATLAGRYMQKTGQTELAIAYLSTMAKTARNQSIKKSYEVRLKALEAVRVIEKARECYLRKNGRLPASVEALTTGGCLERIPADPYGGRFYFEPDGSVATTSNFAFVTKGTAGVNQ